MIRLLLSTLIPLLAPTVFFFVWIWIRNRYVLDHDGKAPPVERGVWFWLLILGGVLVLAVFAVSALTGPSGAPDDRYVPPVEKDGVIIPGHFEKRSAPQTPEIAPKSYENSYRSDGTLSETPSGGRTAPSSDMPSADAPTAKSAVGAGQ